MHTVLAATRGLGLLVGRAVQAPRVSTPRSAIQMWRAASLTTISAIKIARLLRIARLHAYRTSIAKVRVSARVRVRVRG